MYPDIKNRPHMLIQPDHIDRFSAAIEQLSSMVEPPSAIVTEHQVTNHSVEKQLNVDLHNF